MAHERACLLEKDLESKREEIEQLKEEKEEMEREVGAAISSGVSRFSPSPLFTLPPSPSLSSISLFLLSIPPPPPAGRPDCRAAGPDSCCPPGPAGGSAADGRPPPAAGDTLRDTDSPAGSHRVFQLLTPHTSCPSLLTLLTPHSSCTPHTTCYLPHYHYSHLTHHTPHYSHTSHLTLHCLHPQLQEEVGRNRQLLQEKEQQLSKMIASLHATAAQVMRR